MTKVDSLFSASDEREFKRAFVIQFLASHDAVSFEENCRRGWKHHVPLVEDAACLAEKAWEKWQEIIGVKS